MPVTIPRDLELASLDRPDAASPATFRPDEVADLPAPVRRYFETAIAPGTPLATAVRLRMSGAIRLRGWMPFTAAQALAPHRGFVWRARVRGGLFSGADRYVDGLGAMDFRLLGLVPVMRASGPDVSRSAAGRCGAEAVWVPTALLPRFGVEWSATDDTHATARFRLDDTDLEIRFRFHPDGRLASATFERWGDPDETGTFGLHPFGIEATASATFDGVTVPSEGRVGWFHGTDRWEEGEFFRFRLTELELAALQERGQQ